VNATIQQILDTQVVSDGERTYPLGHSHMDAGEGARLQRAVEATTPRVSLEVGMAYGLSTLFICDAMRRHAPGGTHIVIDPFQRSDWHDVGRWNVRQAGFEPMVRFIEERSEFVLPRLLSEGTVLDFALIDGWHTFDQALVEFYYINRMLRVGGIVAFDDADWPSLNRLLRFIVAYPAYEVFEGGALKGVSLLGRLRRKVAASKRLGRLLHPSIRMPSWELNLQATCITLRKIDDDNRAIRWHPDF
jgi:predicted O-methyltransferase YrrM